MTYKRETVRNQGGFTLIEMLVSLSVIAMVSTVMIIGIARMDLRQRLFDQRDAPLDKIAAAQFLLRHRIAYALPLINPQTGNTLQFIGQQVSVDFDGDPPDNEAPDAMQRYRLRLERSGDLMLYRLTSLNDTIDRNNAAVTGWQSTRLVSGARALSISYYGRQPALAPSSGTLSGWRTNWSNRDVLPVLVSIRVDFPAGDKRSWPDLVIRLLAANGDNCERDLRSGDCKGSI